VFFTVCLQSIVYVVLCIAIAIDFEVFLTHALLFLTFIDI